MIKRDILFLVYQNRSGSTFLANQLSEHPNLAVAPEGHNPLERLLGQSSKVGKLGEQIERLEQSLREDRKLSSWQLAPSLLRKRAASARDEVDIFYSLCDTFADTHRQNATWVAVKGHFLGDLIARHGYEALQRDRKVRAIFLIRDPRAMFASQRDSLSSQSNKSMQDNPLVAGLRWRQAVDQAARFSNAPFGMMVRYEDLILENEVNLAKIADFLGLDSEQFTTSEAAGLGSLVQLIPDDQKHLHGNVGRRPISSRIDSWTKKLSSRETKALEVFAGRAMRRLGYELRNEGPTSAKEIGAMIDLAGRAGWRKLGKVVRKLKSSG